MLFGHGGTNKNTDFLSTIRKQFLNLHSRDKKRALKDIKAACNAAALLSLCARLFFNHDSLAFAKESFYAQEQKARDTIRLDFLLH